MYYYFKGFHILRFLGKIFASHLISPYMFYPSSYGQVLLHWDDEICASFE